MQTITLISKSTPEQIITLNVSSTISPTQEIIEVETTPNSPKGTIASGSYKIRRHPQDPSRGILIHTQTQQIEAFHITQNQGQAWIWLAGKSYCIEEATVKNSVASAAGIFRSEVKAPMPGKILQVLASEDAELNAQQAIIVMESMKMELSLTVEVPCKVKQILCQPNQLVDMNAVLATLTEL